MTTPIRTESLTVSRTARLALLGPVGRVTREIWYVLHGYGQLAAPFLDGCRALDDGTRLIVAPEALSRYYEATAPGAPHRDAPVGASWMTREARDSEIADYIAYLDTLHATLVERLHGAGDPPRVTVLGFSQGGATAARWVASGRIAAERLIVWGSQLPPELDLATHGTPLRAAELLLVVGATDGYATPKIVERERQRLHEADMPFRFLSFSGGHRLDDDTLRSIAGGDVAADATGQA